MQDSRDVFVIELQGAMETRLADSLSEAISEASDWVSDEAADPLHTIKVREYTGWIVVEAIGLADSDEEPIDFAIIHRYTRQASVGEPRRRRTGTDAL